MPILSQMFASFNIQIVRQKILGQLYSFELYFCTKSLKCDPYYYATLFKHIRHQNVEIIVLIFLNTLDFFKLKFMFPSKHKEEAENCVKLKCSSTRVTHLC